MARPVSAAVLDLDRSLFAQPDVDDARPTLDLVVPALNEESRIGATIAAICEAAAHAPFDLRLIVVDNGCVDTTADVVDPGGWPIPVELTNCRTRGKGAAVRAGIAKATAPFVGYTDADLSTPPDSIARGIDLLAAGWEVVIGSRRCAGARYVLPQSRLRRLGSLGFRMMAMPVCGGIADTQCGFKLFHSAVARRLFEPATLDGFAFDVEILAAARRADLRIIELPIHWTDHEESSFRPLTDGLKSFRELRELHRSFRHPRTGLGAAP